MRFSYLMLAFAGLIVACTLRGFRPPPEPYEEFAHKSRKVNSDEVKASMIDCGYLPEWGFSGKPENNYQLRMGGK